MTSIITTPKVLQLRDESIRPGMVGSVGDTLVATRFRQSTPDQPVKMEITEPYPWLGAHITDGFRGATGNVKNMNWASDRHFDIGVGWRYQDARAPDKLLEPMLGAQPQYDWQNKVARSYNAKIQGQRFLPAPGGYGLAPGQVPRGGSVPRVVAVAGKETLDEPVAGADLTTGVATFTTPRVDENLRMQMMRPGGENAKMR